jgi:hypothetical protein
MLPRLPNLNQARERRIDKIKRRLLLRSSPRLQVSLILSFTGIAGLVTSFSLLHLGVPLMWLRYPIAILLAYGVFLLLLRLWLYLQRNQDRISNVDVDLPGIDFTTPGASGYGGSFHGGGGNFGGGGVSGTWGGGASSPSSVSSGSSFSDAISFDLDLEEGWLLVIAVVAFIGGIVAAFYIVYIAPSLLAEILLDGALVAGLYRRVKRIEQRHWLRAAVRRTLVPALLAAMFFTVAGYALQRAVPEAHSIGEVWTHVREAKR